MPTVFISYRRDDTAGSAGRVYDRLVYRLGRERVYRDVDSGQPGEDFVETIARKVEECDVLLALIGPDWLRAVDETGGWRLAKDDDLVRVEIATALDRGIRVIPVVLDGAKMPRTGDLPSSLAKLAHRNAVEVRDTHFDQDVAQLLDNLTSHSVLRRLVRPFARHGKWGATALLLVGAIGGVYLSQVAVTAEQARVRLTQMDIAYTEDAFVKAAERRDTKAIELFLRAGMNPNSRSGRGVVALQWAAANGDLPLMKVLLKAGANFEPALEWAAGNGQMEAMQLLMDRDPSKAALDSALIAAADQPTAARLLLQRGADPNAFDENKGRTALTGAAFKGQPEVVKLLLEHGAIADAALRDGTRRTPLYLAAGAEGNEDLAIEVAKLLLDKDADIDVRAVDWNSTEGWTPLLAALNKTRWKLAHFLVERGADVNAQSVAAGQGDEQLGFGLTPLMHAAKVKNLEMGMFLLEKGADIGRRTVTGRTALSFAAEGGLTGFVETLLAGGANANDTDKDGWSPLMYASTPGAVEALLRTGANVNARTVRGSTVLFVHAEDRNAEVVVSLLKQGADPNAANNKGLTPLMAAASKGRLKNVQALLEGGASRSARNHAGETALDLARKEKIEDVVDALIASKGAADPQRRR